MTAWDSGLTSIVIAASAAASDPSRWNAMLTALGKRFEATAAAIFARPASPGDAPVLSAAWNLPADGMQHYLDRWVSNDPWFAVARRSPMVSGDCYIGRHLCDWATLERSAFYNEFARSQGVRGLLALLVDDGRRPGIAPLTFLSLYRAPGREEFTPDDRQALKAIQAPLQMALRAHCALSASWQTKRAADAALDAVHKPILVLDREGRVLHANAVAVVGLSRDRWLAIRGGRLVGLTSAAVDAVPMLLRQAASGCVQAARLWRSTPSGGVRCGVVRFVPLAEDNDCRLAWPDGAVLLLIDEQASDIDAQRMTALA
ncbi:MAG TPA: PAS domain-containing protein [Variovorax sp.]|nr:PAS domain-containing protein [Variovorax sp.]